MDKSGEFPEVCLIIDLPPVRFGNERSNEIPGDFARCDVGSPLRYGIHPGVDDKGCTFVLESISM